MFKRKHLPQITAAMIARFRSHLKREGECLVWDGATNEGGYGNMNLGTSDGRQVFVLTHCLSWVISHGPIPDGLCVCHRCDNRLCANDEHLFLGTYADNNNDMIEKGRAFFFDGTHILGTDNTNAKLTDASVIEIRRRFAAGDTATALGLAFGVTKQDISEIVNNRIWRHVAMLSDLEIRSRPAPKIDMPKGESNGNSRLTEAEVIAMRAEYKAGRTTCEKLAMAYGVSKSTVKAIVAGKMWKYLLTPAEADAAKKGRAA